MENLWQSLIPLVEQCWHSYGAEQPQGNLRITRALEPVKAIRTVYRPSLCVVLAGAKQSTLGDKVFRYQAGQCLLASVDVPVSARILKASTDQPYLAFALALEPRLVAELLNDIMHNEGDVTSPVALHTAAIPGELADPLFRLFALTNEPRDMPVLAPLVEREIIWRLLHSPLAAKLKQLGLKDSHTARIGRSAQWLRDHFEQPIRVAELAEMANMSVASFHRHFKAVTQLAPVQYQKQIRLQEARRLLLIEDDIASIGFSVGYESASQFSRDYRKVFGVAPGQDRKLLRQQLKKQSNG